LPAINQEIGKSYDASKGILLGDGGNEEILVANVEEGGGSHRQHRRPHIGIADDVDAKEICHRTTKNIEEKGDDYNQNEKRSEKKKRLKIGRKMKKKKMKRITVDIVIMS
jgi:hypothetical protein